MSSLIVKCKWPIIVFCFALTAFFATQLPKLKIENDAMFEYLPHSTTDYQRLSKAEDNFGSVYSIGVALETDDESFFTPENLTIVNKITKQIENLENVDNIDSVTSIDYVCAEDGSLKAENLIPEELFEKDENGEEYFAGNTDDINDILIKIGSWNEMYDRVIVSDDRKAVQMAIRYVNKKFDENGNLHRLTGDERLATLDEVEEICTKAIEGTHLNYTVYGDPVISKNSRKFMIRDIISLIPLVVLVVIISLFVSFKTFDGTVLPLLTVLMAAIWSCGLMALLHIQFSIISSVIPVALIAVDSAYGIHVLTHYYIALEKIEGELTAEKHAHAISAGLKEVFQAVLLAGITTMVGFISLITSPLEPLHSFAVFTSLGVLFALVLSVIFIPAMLLVKPLSKVGQKSEKMERIIAKTKRKLEKIRELRGKDSTSDKSGSTLYNIYYFFAGTAPRLVLFCAVIVLCSTLGIKKLVIDTAFINYFPETSKPRQDVKYVNNRFAGTATVYMLVSAPEDKSKDEVETVANEPVSEELPDFDDFGALTETSIADELPAFDDFGSFESDSTEEAPGPVADMTNVDVLQCLENLQQYLMYHNPDIGKIVSFTTFLKRMNQVMNAPAPDSDAISSVAYREQLKDTITYEECVKLFSDAIVEAGGSSATANGIVEALEKRLNYNGAAYYEVPYDVKKYPVVSRDELSNLVSQYIMLLGGDSLDRFAIPKGSFSPKQLRVQIQIRKNSTIFVGKVIRDAEEYVAKYFPEGYTVEFTGSGQMEYVMTNLIVKSQLISLLLSLLSVFIIIAISFRSVWAGLLGTVPLAFTILINYMVMGFAGINLDLITSIIASVAIGVGIDYTIHFLETFRNERHLTDNMEEVLKNTFMKTGSGIVTNALAIGIGFLVLCFSQFVVLRYIGILVAIVMFSSSMLAMTIIPSILHLTDPKFMRKEIK